MCALLLLLLSRFSRVRLCATPIDGSPPGSPVPGILQARVLEWVAIAFSVTSLDSVLKEQKHHLVDKSHSYSFSCSYVQMWELDHKEGWAPKNWCFRTVMLEKTLESPLDSKEIKPVNPKENQPWIFIGRTDAKAEAPILWPADAKSILIGKIVTFAL